MSDSDPFAKWPHLDAPGPRHSDGGEGASPSRQLAEIKRPTERDDEMANSNGFENFLGGTPASVFMKLFFVSLIVGALLMWLDVRPMDILRGVRDFIDRIYALGFGAIRELINYLLAGAAIVVPAWFLLRLLSLGSRR